MTSPPAAGRFFYEEAMATARSSRYRLRQRYDHEQCAGDQNRQYRPSQTFRPDFDCGLADFFHQSASRIDIVGFQEAFFRGTFLPAFRALESPIAMACLRLFTLPLLPSGPLLAVPRLYRCISLFTSLPRS